MNDKQFRLLLTTILIVGREDQADDTIDICFKIAGKIMDRYDIHGKPKKKPKKPYQTDRKNLYQPRGIASLYEKDNE